MEAKSALEVLLDDWNRTIQLKSHVCFYGGSFNPWHDGHKSCLELAKAFYKRNQLDVDIVISIDNNPWKEQSLTEAVKLELYKKIKSQSGHSLIYPGFLLEEKATPTYDWLKDFKESTLKSVDLLIGFDNFEKFDQWKNYEELIKLLDRLLIVSRLDKDELKESMLKKLNNLSPQTSVEFLGNHDFEDLSSTALRNKRS